MSTEEAVVAEVPVTAAQEAKRPPMDKKGKEKKPAAHPPYAQIILEAIAALKERTGSSTVAISKYAEQKHGGKLPTNFRKQLAVQLKKLSAAGKLTRVKNSFKLPATRPAAAHAKPKAVKPTMKPKASPKAKAKTTAKPMAAASPKAEAKAAPPKVAKTSVNTSPAKAAMKAAAPAAEESPKKAAKKAATAKKAAATAPAQRGAPRKAKN